ncbi:hypothetical protein EBH_0056920 [Eimeria brunetti]|uniref:Uncharacterized protein n=1 Tax=Eimeria brunetti TaxID=51314 RepID=U6LW01_9EIME|nr:hypothetical protein EBH_0056920 [Eimeria brunetti]
MTKALKKAVKAEALLTNHNTACLQPYVAAKQELRASEKTQKELQQRRQQLQQQLQQLQQDYQQQQQQLLRQEEQGMQQEKELKERVQQAKEDADTFWNLLPAQQETIKGLQQQLQQLHAAANRKREAQAGLLLAVKEAQQQTENFFRSYLQQLEICRRSLPPPMSLRQSLLNCENEPPLQQQQQQQQQQQEQQQQQKEQSNSRLETPAVIHKPLSCGAPN